MIRVSSAFAPAIEDYEYLLNRAYSPQRAIELVGNHYQLSKEERLLLFRGIRPASEVLALECRILPPPSAVLGAKSAASPSGAFPSTDHLVALQPEPTLLIDGYNVLFTIISYLSGKPVFIANDALARDIGAFHGRGAQKRHLVRAMEMLAEVCLESFPGFSVHLFLDAPISESAAHKAMLETLFADHAAGCREANFRAELLHSADYGLEHAESGILCTSDSVILAASNLAILDLARFMLESTFGVRLDNIRDLRIS